VLSKYIFLDIMSYCQPLERAAKTLKFLIGRRLASDKAVQKEWDPIIR